MRLLLAPSLLVILGCAGVFSGDGLFDIDADGHRSAVDCNDFDAAIHPGAGERCDGKVDEDCDGAIDDQDDDVVDPAAFFEDSDGDGFGNPRAATREACIPPDGYVANDDDCDDGDDAIHPEATEECDEARTDEDCDGEADDDDDSVRGRVDAYLDDDGDGYGDASDAEPWCHPPSDRVDDATDCDDGDRDVNPGEDEVCDNRDVDEDCDGASDDDDPQGADDAPWWYTDADGDGYGNGSERREACEAGAGEVSVARDCDDDDPDFSPDAEEICGDGLDQDCDGSAAGCVPTGDVEDADGDALILAGEADALYGWAVSSGGDSDGDGLAEVWIAGPAAAGLGTGSGGAFRVDGRLGGVADPSGHGLLVVRSTDVFELGYAIAGGADLDGDGLDDVAFGAPSHDAGATDAGAVYLLGGGLADGASEADAVAARLGSAAEEYLGFSVALGDWNGDGVGDLFTMAGSGEVYGELGPLAPGEAIGRTVADVEISASVTDRIVLGDVDGDGVDELAVGNFGGSEVEIYSGGGTGGDLLATIDSSYTAMGLGFALTMGADLDGDGLGDLAVGAPYCDDARGLVYIVHGPLAGGTYADEDVDVELRHETAGEYFGYALAAEGDMNANDDVELAVGAPGSSVSGSYAGAVYVFDEAPRAGTHEITTADLVVRGAHDYGQNGVSVGMTDLDGDGSSDLVVAGLNLGGEADAGGAAIFYGALP